MVLMLIYTVLSLHWRKSIDSDCLKETSAGATVKNTNNDVSKLNAIRAKRPWREFHVNIFM